MIKLVALKRLRYPRGPDGKEYNAGDPFEALCERDAKALKLVRAARDAEVATPAKAEEPTKPPLRRPALPLVQGSLGVEGNADESPSPRRRRTYHRTDMRSED